MLYPSAKSEVKMHSKNMCDSHIISFFLFFFFFRLFFLIARGPQINLPVIITFLAIHVQDKLQFQFFRLQLFNLQDKNPSQLQILSDNHNLADLKCLKLSLDILCYMDSSQSTPIKRFRQICNSTILIQLIYTHLYVPLYYWLSLYLYSTQKKKKNNDNQEHKYSFIVFN